MNESNEDYKADEAEHPRIENAKAYATWSISLDCECPHCEQEVDLLDASDFWDGAQFQVGEHGTEKTKNVTVYCPNCLEDFNADLEY